MRNNIHFKKGREDRQFYADQIPGAWEQMIAATRTFGYSVVSSRIDLTPNDWRELVTEDCPLIWRWRAGSLRASKPNRFPA